MFFFSFFLNVYVSLSHIHIHVRIHALRIHISIFILNFAQIVRAYLFNFVYLQRLIDILDQKKSELILNFGKFATRECVCVPVCV